MADSFSNVLPPIDMPDLPEWSAPCRPGGQSWTPLLWPNVGLFTSLMPFLHPEAVPLSTHRRAPSSPENCPLSDDEKRERIRLQELMRNPEHIEWEDEPIELSNLNFGRNDSPRDALMDSEGEQWEQ
ncbi:hypothetical protein KR067_007306 [Drosophila pandora]|nr:hypothetical protein KR067_007306 [Drosophila pandora]